MPDLEAKLANLADILKSKPFSRANYVDLDPIFLKLFDEDFDEEVNGISRSRFLRVHLPWIHYCLRQRQRLIDRRRLRQADKTSSAGRVITINIDSKDSVVRDAQSWTGRPSKIEDTMLKGGEIPPSDMKIPRTQMRQSQRMAIHDKNPGAALHSDMGETVQGKEEVEELPSKYSLEPGSDKVRMHYENDEY
ncbi:unnamed protein product [Protopolystoma xenopodis]|uniref:Uncharacterized protein n=1 Tax=Protopolystoma xenopodis TaxID=117903 RepID=A0A3S5FE09_9PLAT|nr:unnamed protein product [Protopolystoma xenopodis]